MVFLINIELNNEEKLCKWSNNDQEHYCEILWIIQCLNDQVDEISCIAEESTPIEHLNPHTEAAATTDNSNKINRNDDLSWNYINIKTYKETEI